VRKERSVLAVAEEREYTREILRRTSDLRNVNYVMLTAVMQHTGEQ